MTGILLAMTQDKGKIKEREKEKNREIYIT